MIDFKAVLTGLDGSPLKDADTPITLGAVCINALLAVMRGDEGLPGTEKVKRALLAQHIHTGGKEKLPAEDIALVKDLVGKAYPPIVVMRAWEALDP